MNFNSKNIIITGASTGIGEATAKLFADSKAKVYNLDIQKPAYSHEFIEYIPCDVTQYQDVKNAFDYFLTNDQKLDFLFANAGIHLFANLEETSLEDLDRVININLKGVYYCLKCAVPIMKKQKAGSIVLMGSDQSLIGKGESSIYGATKGAIAQLTKSTAIDYAKYNIRINCICPGTIDTPLVHQAIQFYANKTNIDQQEIYQSLKTSQPMQRLGNAKEIANIVAFLCSDLSSFMTGSLISADGGYVAQ